MNGKSFAGSEKNWMGTAVTVRDKGEESLMVRPKPKDRLLASLAYLGILLVIPWLAGGKDPFIRYHLNQGIVLLLTGSVCLILSWIPFLGVIRKLLGCVILAYVILGTYNVCRDRMEPLPLIGNFIILK